MPIGYLDSQGNWQELKHYTDPIPGERKNRMYIDFLGNEQEDSEMDNMMKEHQAKMKEAAKRTVTIELSMLDCSCIVAGLVLLSSRGLMEGIEVQYGNAIDTLLKVLAPMKEESNRDS